MIDSALVVFTVKTKRQLLEMGGTSSWAVNPASVRRCKYVVCTRNTDPSKALDGSTGSEPHGSAFFVGRIAGLKNDGLWNGRQRYLIRFDAFAEIAVDRVWDGSRTPTRYIPLADLKAKGLDIDSLDFTPMESETDEDNMNEVSQPHHNGLSLAEAKAGLALTFGVPVENIEILIKG